MKLAISISGNTLDSPFDARFGRAAAFCIVDTETGEWQAFENPALSASGGAGVQASQFVAETWCTGCCQRSVWAECLRHPGRC